MIMTAIDFLFKGIYIRGVCALITRPPCNQGRLVIKAMELSTIYCGDFE
jgi:hypothetical protein